ncbi:hypothetical protein PXD04_11340 (plasmid) [Methanosphaera sp. ISO3-F5]|uniref:hypothetical protein n=1 Tax=Methanosphaera sp. ISO3-F5 TaxID=1452353 RepID=UPI002B25E3B7|nr:hypothetical protein [Methanosphaera sp. ISO3-F5]WQH65336.1 hypothetical protein PXD04_11340 [Methanosphaera sp. ISO3-F5]
MKYNKIIHINENFVPVFDLENEEENYWSLFIPNENFRHILRSVLNSLNIKNPKNPVWLQGTYGTGKSHATSVIKHLLCDEVLSNSFNLEDEQLTAKLKSFRDKNKVFPVIIKGTSTIGDSRRFTFTLQSAVKKALKEKDMNISIPSEYENMISILKEGGYEFLRDEDLKGTTLEAYGKDEIIYRLENEESDILLELENIFMKKNLSPVTQETIHQWLINVKDELKNKYDYDYLIIFWDEFTGALNLPNVDDILLQIQNIAESKNKGISLFIVSHRTRTNQTNINQEYIDKVLDRFEPIYYSMESVATYELMASSINRDTGWEKEKNRFMGQLHPLIEKISANDSPKVKKALEELYPIHPYTARLATAIAEHIGSSERSIFKFLHDDQEFGFKNFINTVDIDDRYFLTAEYLWDFFIDDFIKINDEKVNSAIQKYNMYHSSLEKKGIEYVTIFKVILLLNILFKMVDSSGESLLIPSSENIFNVYVGSIYESKVETVLDYIDKNRIINKNPENIFELTTNSLPSDQIDKEKNKIKNGLKLTDLLDSKQKNNIITFVSKKLNREMNMEFIDANIRENNLIARLEKNKGNPAYLQMYLFLCQNAKEFDSIKKNIKSIADKGLLDNKLMIISKASFDVEYLNKYLDYKANSIVAKKHNYVEESARDEKYAKKIIDSWVNDIKRKYVEYYLNDIHETILFPEFIDKTNRSLSKKIFSYGLENIDGTIINSNLWSNSKAKVLSEKYITSKSYIELRDSLNGLDKKSTEIFYDNNMNLIIDSKFNLVDTVPDNHPIKILQDFVDKKLLEAQINGKFNIGDVLKPLTKTPYGYYPNILNIAAISFVLRKYVNKLYDSNGQPINETKMKNKIIPLFNYWEKGKNEQDLYVRFGSEDEKRLIDLLNDVFNLELDVETQSISNVRWAIKEWIKNNKTPLWLFEYSNNINEESINALKALNDLLKPDDLNIPDNLIQSCYNSLTPVKFDFKIFLKSDKNQLFEKLILEIDEEVNKEKIPDIIKYIIQKMPEEVNNWKKEIVITEISKWITQDLRKQTDVNVDKPDNSEVPADVSVSKSDKSEVPADVSVSKSDKSEVPADVSVSKSDKSEVPADVSVSKSDKSEVPADVSVSKSDNSEVSADSVDKPVKTDINTPTEPVKDILTKVRNMDANKLKSILIQALEEHHEIQTVLDNYLEK